MKVLGIIAEYNPFHNGHSYQLDACRQLAGADYTVNGGKIGETTQKLYDMLTGIQWGKLPDPYGWTLKI